jgi:hypothetical protein
MQSALILPSFFAVALRICSNPATQPEHGTNRRTTLPMLKPPVTKIRPPRKSA